VATIVSGTIGVTNRVYDIYVVCSQVIVFFWYRSGSTASSNLRATDIEGRRKVARSITEEGAHIWIGEEDL